MHAKSVVFAVLSGLFNLLVSAAAAGAILYLFGSWWETHAEQSLLFKYGMAFYGFLAVLVLGSVIGPVRRRLRDRPFNLLDLPCLFPVLLAVLVFLALKGVFGEAITRYF